MPPEKFEHSFKVAVLLRKCITMQYVRIVWFFFSADIRNLTEKAWSAFNDMGTCCYFTQQYLRNTNFDWLKKVMTLFLNI